MVWITTRITLSDKNAASFADWQARLNAEIAAFPGFVSLEISCHEEAKRNVWTLVQRFQSLEALAAWQNSSEREALFQELNASVIQELGQEAASARSVITEIFVTRVDPEREEEYRNWISKIHHAEAQFPGFRGMYLQSPAQGQGENWISLLQFDTVENLDQWLSSPERQALLREGEPLVMSLESHRMISPFAGWFASLSKKGKPPPLLKQTLLILLVLFPIVMLESKFLNPFTAGLRPALAMFIGNTISVFLISWPFLPFAIRQLSWWLQPPPEAYKKYNLMGFILIFLLYLIEIAIFWNFK